jgi:hypothetical protein
MLPHLANNFWAFDKLEQWINDRGSGGINIAGFIMKILLYADAIILAARTLCSIQKHLQAHKIFCSKVGMDVT